MFVLFSPTVLSLLILTRLYLYSNEKKLKLEDHGIVLSIFFEKINIFLLDGVSPITPGVCF